MAKITLSVSPEALRQASEDLKKTAKKIRAIAEQIRDVELEAGRIANEH